MSINEQLVIKLLTLVYTVTHSTLSINFLVITWISLLEAIRALGFDCEASAGSILS